MRRGPGAIVLRAGVLLILVSMGAVAAVAVGGCAHAAAPTVAGHAAALSTGQTVTAAAPTGDPSLDRDALQGALEAGAGELAVLIARPPGGDGQIEFCGDSR